MAKLLVHEHAGIREYELVDAEVQLGRELDNALRLPDPSISRHHCVVRKTASGYEIQDLQSSNGVLLNGNRVQISPLRDGDRITLGQIQLTFVNPAEGATVAIQASSANPLGTVRMTSEQMAAVHGGAQAPKAPLPSKPPAPAPPAAPPPVPKAPAPAPLAPAPMASAGEGPEFGHFTGPAAVPNPAPGFLRPYLPSIPDTARPTGERGDFGSRLLAMLIDAAPVVAIYLVLSVALGVLARLTPGLGVLGCFLGPVLWLAVLAYQFLFIPWCWIKFGATPGKKIMKLRVVPEDNPHGRIDVGAAVLRMVGYWVNGLVLGLPYLMILGSERKGLQDIFSKSLVIKVQE